MKILFDSNSNFKKRYLYVKKINKNIFKLKSICNTKQKDVDSDLLTLNKSEYFEMKNQKSADCLVVMYVIHFLFSPTNMFLYVTDISGNLKFVSSGGLVGFKGKEKKVRLLVLKRFLNLLGRLKVSFLKNRPIALHLNNVGSFRSFIIKRLKKYFFIRIIKNYELYSYNGCRKRKKVRKRQRSKRF